MSICPSIQIADRNLNEFHQKMNINKNLMPRENEFNNEKNKDIQGSMVVNRKNKIKKLLPTTFNCDICSRSFKNNSHLSNHNRIHTKNHNFQCKNCGKIFKALYRLKIHCRTHTGIKPFNCTMCEKAFNEKGNLITHIRIHNGERPFQCNFPECPSKFKTKGQLSDHIKTHTGEKSYVCLDCNKSFIRSSALKVHQTIHLKGKSNLYLKIDKKSREIKEDLSLHQDKLKESEGEILLLGAKEMMQNNENLTIKNNIKRIPLFMIEKKSESQKNVQRNISFNKLKDEVNLNSFNQSDFLDNKLNPETPRFNSEYEILNQMNTTKMKVPEIPIPRKTKSEYINLSPVNSNFDFSKLMNLKMLDSYYISPFRELISSSNYNKDKAFSDNFSFAFSPFPPQCYNLRNLPSPNFNLSITPSKKEGNTNSKLVKDIKEGYYFSFNNN